MKNFKKLLLTLILILPFAFLLSACSLEPSIVDIEKKYSINNTSTYVITYSNGKQKSFTIENGKDGKDGKSLTIEEIKKYCEENDITIEQFFETYLDIDVNINPVKYIF